MKDLGKALVADGLITKEQLDEALRNHAIFGGLLSSNLVELEYTDEPSLLRFFTNKLSFSKVKKSEIDKVPAEVIQLLPRHMVEEYQVAPLAVADDALRLLMFDPTDEHAINAVAKQTGLKVQPIVGLSEQVDEALSKHYDIRTENGVIDLEGTNIEEQIAQITRHSVEEPFFAEEEGPPSPSTYMQMHGENDDFGDTVDFHDRKKAAGKKEDKAGDAKEDAAKKEAAEVEPEAKAEPKQSPPDVGEATVDLQNNESEKMARLSMVEDHLQLLLFEISSLKKELGDLRTEIKQREERRNKSAEEDAVDESAAEDIPADEPPEVEAKREEEPTGQGPATDQVDEDEIVDDEEASKEDLPEDEEDITPKDEADEQADADAEADEEKGGQEPEADDEAVDDEVADEDESEEEPPEQEQEIPPEDEADEQADADVEADEEPAVQKPAADDEVADEDESEEESPEDEQEIPAEDEADEQPDDKEDIADESEANQQSPAEGDDPVTEDEIDAMVLQAVMCEDEQSEADDDEQTVTERPAELESEAAEDDASATGRVRGPKRSVVIDRVIDQTDTSDGDSEKEEASTKPKPDLAPEDEKDVLDYFDVDGAKPDAGDGDLSTIYDVQRVLEKAKDRDEIADAVLTYAIHLARRAAIFILKKHMINGWNGKGDNLNQELVARIKLPSSVPSIFSKVMEEGKAYLGPVPDQPVNQKLLSVMGSVYPEDVFVLPIYVREKLICFFYADNGDGRALDPDAIEDLQLLDVRIANAFELLIKATRRDVMGE